MGSIFDLWSALLSPIFYLHIAWNILYDDAQILG